MSVNRSPSPGVWLVSVPIGFEPNSPHSLSPQSTELEQLKDQCAEHITAHSTVHLILFYCLYWVYGASMRLRWVTKTLTGTLALDDSQHCYPKSVQMEGHVCN